MGWMQIVRGAVLVKVRALVAADAELTADGWTVHRTRPGSADLPCVWLDGPDLTMTHDAGARSTLGEVRLVCATNPSDNDEARDRLAVLADALVDGFSADPHVIGGRTVLEPTAVSYGEVDVGAGTSVPAAIITLGRFLTAEGWAGL